MSSQIPTSSWPRTRKTWEFVIDTQNARIAAAVIVVAFAIAAFRQLFAAHMEKNGADPTTGQAIYQFIVEFGVPAAIYMVVTIPLCWKRPSKPKRNARDLRLGLFVDSRTLQWNN
jgi:hypothetical protein